MIIKFYEIKIKFIIIMITIKINHYFFLYLFGSNKLNACIEANKAFSLPINYLVIFRLILMLQFMLILNFKNFHNKSIFLV